MGELVYLKNDEAVCDLSLIHFFTHPPYGERLEDRENLPALYSQICLLYTSIQKGRSEEDVMGELGDPRLIARTIIDTSGGGQSSYQQAGRQSGYYEEESADVYKRQFQVIGKSLWATLLSAARQGIFFLPLILLLPPLIGLYGVQLTQPLADLFTFAACFFFLVPFFRELNAQVEEQERTA